MKRVKVIKKGVVISEAAMAQDELNEWLEEHIEMESFGKDAWSEEVEVTPAVFTELEVEPGVFEQVLVEPPTYKTVNHPAEFTYEITDTTLEDAATSAKQKGIQDAKVFLETVNMQNVTTVTGLKAVVQKLLESMG